jgi:hypothetical protein
MHTTAIPINLIKAGTNAYVETKTNYE